MKLNLVVVIFMLFGSAYSELALIAKSRSVLSVSVNTGKNVLTGIEILDEINAYYCCNKIDKVYTNIKDTVLAKKLGMDRVYIFTLDCNTGDPSKVIWDYKETGLFEHVEVNQQLKSTSTTPFYPNDPAFSVWQWPLHNTGNVMFLKTREDVDIDMPEGWGLERGDSSVIIAILDSGIKNQNNEFDGRMWKNKGEIPGDKLDNDNNGFKDDVYGWNFAYGNDSLADDNGHGTAVASIIGANSNNGKAMAGINSVSKLMVLKTSNVKGITYGNTIADAIRYATDNGARVVNFSHASSTSLTFVENAVRYAWAKGVLVCAGSGNDGVNTVYYPARLANVIAVGATDAEDKRPVDWLKSDSTIGGSNYGDSLDVVAPGDSVVCLSYINGSTQFQSGTSIATAFVTGLASLLISQNPDITPDVVTQIIESSAEDQIGDPSEDTKGYDKYYGYGRINAYKALLKGEELKTGKKPKALVNKEISKWIHWSRLNRQLSINVYDSKMSSSGIVVRIVNASGKVLKVVTLPHYTGLHSISLPSLSSGVYFYSVQCDNDTWSGKIDLCQCK
jgi:subtilisin family serine protease